MNKNHFIFGYYGNKRQEVEKIYDKKYNVKQRKTQHIIISN